MAGLQNNKAAVIFDMDGVIVDSAKYHYLTWRTLLAKRGVDYSYEAFTHNFGRRTDLQVRRILGEIPDTEVQAIVREKDILFRQIVGDNITAFPGVVDLVKSLKASGRKVAVGSSSPTETVHLIVGKLGVKDYFDAIVCGSEVTEGKPSPQIFLTAARKMAVSPDKCVVVEDAMVGITAAKNGGMRVVAVTNTHSREELHEADMIVDSMQELNVECLDGLLPECQPAFPNVINLNNVAADGLKLK